MRQFTSRAVTILLALQSDFLAIAVTTILIVAAAIVEQLRPEPQL